MSGETWLPPDAWDPAGVLTFSADEAQELGLGLWAHPLHLTWGGQTWPSYWEGEELRLWTGPLNLPRRRRGVRVVSVPGGLRLDVGARPSHAPNRSMRVQADARDLLEVGEFVRPGIQRVAARAVDLELGLRGRRALGAHHHPATREDDALHLAWLSELLHNGPLTAALFGGTWRGQVDLLLQAVADGLAAGLVDSAAVIGDRDMLTRRWRTLAPPRPRRIAGALTVTSEDGSDITDADLVIVTRPSRLAWRDHDGPWRTASNVWLLDDVLTGTASHWVSQWEDRHGQVDVVASRDPGPAPSFLRWAGPDPSVAPETRLKAVAKALETGGVPGRSTAIVVPSAADRRTLLPDSPVGREAGPVRHDSGVWLLPGLHALSPQIDVVVATHLDDSLLDSALAGRLLVLGAAPETREALAADLIESLWSEPAPIRLHAAEQSVVACLASGDLSLRQVRDRVARLRWESTHRTRRAVMEGDERHVQPATLASVPTWTAEDIETWESLLVAAHGERTRIVPRSPGHLEIGHGANWPLETPKTEPLQLDVAASAAGGIAAYPGSTAFQAIIDNVTDAAVAVEVIDVPDLSTIEIPQHAPDLELVRRSWRRPREAAVTATCVVHARGRADHVRTVREGSTTSTRHRRRWLEAGTADDPALPVMASIRRAFDAAERRAREDATADGLHVQDVRVVSAEIRGGADVTIRHLWRRRDGQELETISPLPRSGAPVVTDPAGTPVRQLGICSDLHVVEAVSIARCPACDGDRCGFCDGGTEQPACPLCLEPACRHCVGDGACFACRNAQRVPELDTTYEHAWLLRSGTLFVSRGGARLVQDGDEILMGLAPDVTNPLRAAAREAAVAAGLPWDTPVVAGPKPKRARRASMSWTVDHTTRWVVDVSDQPTGFGQFPRPDLLPRSPVAITGLDTRGADAVVAHLRDVDPPPASMELVARPATEAIRLELGAQGFSLRTTYVDAVAGSVEKENHKVDLQPVLPVVTDDGILVAQSTFGGVTVSLLRVHRDHLLRVDDHGAVHEYWHGKHDASSERAWHRLLDSLGVVVPARVLVPAEGIPDRGALNFEGGTTSFLEERSVTVRPVRVAGGLPAARPPSAADLLALERHALSWDVSAMATRASRGLDAVLDALGLEAPEPVVVTSGHTVREVWRGSGTAMVERDAIDGVLPPLPVVGATAGSVDFDVDTTGHLHALDVGWTCRACRGAWCPACPPDRRLAACSTCGQLACGVCVAATTAAEVGEACVDCGRVECSSCESRNDLAPCPSCQRDVCWHCRRTGVCEVCSSLSSDTMPPAEALESLGADPAAVRVGRTPRGEIIISVSQGRRREVAVWDGAQVVSWAVDSANELPLADATLSRRLSSPAEVDLGPSPLSEDDLDRGAGELADGDVLLRWTFESVEVPAVEADVRVSPRESFDERLAKAIDPDLTLPAPAHIGALQDLRVPFAPPVEPIRPRADRSSGVVDIVLDEDGLVDVASGDRLEWMATRPAKGRYGRRMAIADHPRVDAFVEAVGRARLVVLEGEFGHHVMVDAEDRADAVLTDVAAAFGLDAITPIVAALDARTVMAGDHIRGAKVLETSLEPLIEVVETSGTSKPLVGRAVETWLRRSRLPLLDERRTWAWGDIPGLPEDFRGWKPDAGGRVGYAVRQVVEKDGVAVELAYEAWPPSRRPRLVWGEIEAKSITVDREYHAVPKAATCGMCNEATCEKCDDLAIPCEVCRMLVCRRCTASAALHVCPACGALARSPTRGLKAIVGFRPKAAARGDDDVHRVDVVVDREGQLSVWVRPEGASAAARVLPTPPGRAHMRDIFR